MLTSKEFTLKVVLVILIFSSSQCRAGITPFADLLIWKISEQTSSIWANISTLSDKQVYNNDVKNIDFNWKGGVRTGFLYEPQQNYFILIRSSIGLILLMIKNINFQLVITSLLQDFLAAF